MGEAGVLGTSVNPLQVYMQYQQRRAQQEYAIAQQQRKRRDDVIDYVDKYNPEAKWDPFKASINEMAETLVRQPAREALLNRGEDPNQIMSRLGQAKAMVTNRIAELDTWKGTYDEADKTLTGDAKYTPEARSRLRDIFLTHDFKPKKDDEIRQALPSVENILNDPKLFNTAVVTKRFMDNLPVQARNVLGKIRADGTTPTEQDIAGQLPYQYDEITGRVKLDPITQSPLMKMTDQLYQLAMGDKDLRLLMQDEGRDTRAKQEAYLKTVLPMFDKTKVDNKVTAARQPTEGEIGRQQVIAAADERFKNNEAVASGFRPDLLAATFDPSSHRKAEYVNAAGEALTRYDANTHTYTKDDGTSTAKGPIAVRVTFTKGGLAEDLEAMNIDSQLQSGQITQTQADERYKGLAQHRGKLEVQNFDITTKTGRRTLHQVLNQLEDERLAAHDRIGEAYTKKVREHYDQQTGGVYTK